MTSPDDPLHLEPLSILDRPDRHDVQFLDDCLYEYNVSRTGIADGRLLAIILRNRHDNIIAGLYGWTWGSCCEVKTLWVHEQWRGQGLSTRLMTAAEDTETAAVTCTHSHCPCQKQGIRCQAQVEGHI